MMNYLVLTYSSGTSRAVAETIEERFRRDKPDVKVHPGVMPKGMPSHETEVWLNSHQGVFVQDERMIQGIRLRGYDGPAFVWPVNGTKQ